MAGHPSSLEGRVALALTDVVRMPRVDHRQHHVDGGLPRDHDARTCAECACFDVPTRRKPDVPATITRAGAAHLAAGSRGDGGQRRRRGT